MDTSELFQMGTRIRMIRKALKMTQKEFGESLGYSHCYVSELEGNKKRPNAASLHKLHTTHNVNLHYLFTGDGKMFLADETKVREDSRGYVEQIRTTRDLLWFLNHSLLFRNYIMAKASEYHLKNETIIKKTLTSAKELRDNKE